MFCVVYRFSVKPGREAEFEGAWRALTLLIRQHQQSLGSRLHRAGEHEYFAYAQWPTREHWESPPALPPAAEEPRTKMRDSCAGIEVLHELEVVTDLLG
jgi:hypothetical protein